MTFRIAMLLLFIVINAGTYEYRIHKLYGEIANLKQENARLVIDLEYATNKEKPHTTDTIKKVESKKDAVNWI